MRNDGLWGSTCVTGFEDSAAKMICIQLGFLDGKILNPPDNTQGTDGFCANYKGEDYCGAPTLPIHFKGMTCSGGEKDIMACYRNMAGGECNHRMDALIECTNTSFDVAALPKRGTVRLTSHDGAIADSGKGRVEYFLGRWGTVCNDNFTDKSAMVACK
jgi:hypothetical protein